MGLPWEGNMNRVYRDGKIKNPSRDKNTASKLVQQAQKKNNLLNKQLLEDVGIRLTSPQKQKNLANEIYLELKTIFPKEKYNQLLVETAMTKAKLIDLEIIFSNLIQQYQNLLITSTQIQEKSKKHGESRNSLEKLSTKQSRLKIIGDEKLDWERKNCKRMTLETYMKWVKKFKFPIKDETLKGYWYYGGIEKIQFIHK
jgi:hypothetical protein